MDILLAEDERSIRVTLRDDLETAGHRVRAVGDGGEAVEILKRERFDCVITDVRLPGADGLEVLRAAKALRPATEVIIITGYGTIEQTVQAMKAGAFDYIQKPFPNEVVLELTARMGRLHNLQAEVDRLRAELDQPGRPHGLVGRSRRMLEVLDTLVTVAPSDATVLIQGESGTGKEVVARALHHLSGRATNAFVPVSCAALPETLIEDELFGHERGAFTDARKFRKGRFELADGGSLFLDDIDDMPQPVQVKLLRILQERSFERIGGEETLRVDVRVIAATKVQLKERVAQGRFREDLFYRLNVVPIVLPPLCEREGDIPALVQHFLRKYGHGHDFVVPAEILEAMERYPWPGNVRELENHVARAIAFAGRETVLKREHLLPPDAASVGTYAKPESAPVPDSEPRPLADVLKEAERAHIQRVLEHTGGHRTRTAELLGISRKTLWEKMKEWGLE